MSFQKIISFANNFVLLPKYGQASGSKGGDVYMNLNEFYKGDEIYFSLSFDDGYQLKEKEMPIGFLELDYLPTQLISYNIQTSTNYTLKKTAYTFYYKIEKTVNNKYLVIKLPYFSRGYESEIIFTLKHIQTISKNIPNDNDNDNDNNNNNNIFDIVGIVVVVFVVLLIIGIILYFCLRRKSSSNSTIDNPLSFPTL